MECHLSLPVVWELLNCLDDSRYFFLVVSHLTVTGTNITASILIVLGSSLKYSRNTLLRHIFPSWASANLHMHVYREDFIKRVARYMEVYVVGVISMAVAASCKSRNSWELIISRIHCCSQLYGHLKLLKVQIAPRSLI